MAGSRIYFFERVPERWIGGAVALLQVIALDTSQRAFSYLASMQSGMPMIWAGPGICGKCTLKGCAPIHWQLGSTPAFALAPGSQIGSFLWGLRCGVPCDRFCFGAEFEA